MTTNGAATVTQGDPAAIAGRLTTAQRDLFVVLAEPSFRGLVAIADLEPLFRKGLIAVDDTPLGLAVRAILQQQDHPHD